MRRWWSITVYGLGGFGLAIAMVWAGFSVAGHRLSTPAQLVQPLGASIPSAVTHATHHPPTPPPSPGDEHGESPSKTFTQAPTTPAGSPSVQVGSPAAQPSPGDGADGGGDD